MFGRKDQPRHKLVDLVKGRPGWRLEPRTTPGASPLWCFVVDGEIEFSVSAEKDTFHLYVMETDKELVFRSDEQLRAWLQAHRPEALGEPSAQPEAKPRTKGFFEWN
jgi:hypothetical protein